MTFVPYQIGFQVALREILEGKASFIAAQQRGLYESSSDYRVAWDMGYADCVCAWRLGHNVEGMAASQYYGPSVVEMCVVVDALLDGTWHLPFRADPRRRELGED